MAVSFILENIIKKNKQTKKKTHGASWTWRPEAGKVCRISDGEK